jgi:transcriptional regulator with XRE-family HTH domain
MMSLDTLSEGGADRNNFVRQARQQLGMTQERFAEALYIARETITRYENGARVSERSIAQIRELLAKACA